LWTIFNSLERTLWVVHEGMSELTMPSAAWAWVAVLLLSYACGSLSFAVLVSRIMGLQDPRTYGSMNPGATNVLRTGHKGAAALTLLLDAFKGWLPVVLFKSLGTDLMGWDLGGDSAFLGLAVMPPHSLGVGLVGLAAFVGHLWPVFFRFQGGKGVATAAGVLVGYQPLLGLGTLLCWLLVARVWRFSSLAALLSALFAPLCYWSLSPALWPAQADVLGCSVVMSVLLIVRHQANLSRLFRGQESRIGG
jgi:glycerol-3-phosphate acyltransferase PlsY